MVGTVPALHYHGLSTGCPNLPWVSISETTINIIGIVMWRARPLANMNFCRRSSTIHPRRRPSYRDLFSGPVAKSLFLTVVFGSVMVDATRNRKEIDALRAAYETKFLILQDITHKIRNKEPVDVAQELKVANAITRNKYNSVTDVELDDQLEEFLKMAEEEEEHTSTLAQASLPQVALEEEKKTAQFL